MNHQDIDTALSHPDYAPAPQKSPLSPMGDSLGITNEQALAVARKFGLVRPDGSIRCIHDHCGGEGQLPSLSCERCRERRGR